MKDPDDFSAKARQAFCRQCVDAYARNYYKANSVRIRQKVAAWRAANPERVRAGYRRRHLERRFGLTQEHYDALLLAQNGRCAICRKPETRNGSSGKLAPLSVDHDHVTGKVRGLLCGSCNYALGTFEVRQFELTAYVARYV